MNDRRTSPVTSIEGHGSLVDLMRHRAAVAPERLAYQFLSDGHREDPPLTYGGLARMVHALARRFRALCQPGERALLLYPQGTEFLRAFFGCLEARLIAIPLPPPDPARWKRSMPRLKSVIQDAEASVVLTTARIQSELREHLGPIAGHLRWISTDAFDLDSPAAGEELEPPPSLNDVAYLQYTSGSTATPKGVMVSHANVLHHCRLLREAAGYDETSVVATWMPYHHDYGLVEGLIQPLFVGAPCYWMSPLAFIKRPVRWLEAISRYRATHSQAPNFAYELCVRKVTAEQRAALDLSSWKCAANGAEPVRPQTLFEFHDTFKECGFRWSSLAPAYGLAEATLVVSHRPAGTHPILLDVKTSDYELGRMVPAIGGMNRQSLVSCGRVLNETRVEIVDPKTHQRCTEHAIGEIWVAGPSVAGGYWNRPDDTSRIFGALLADGQGPFLRTGDLGCVRDGELYVTGRLKDLIIIRGLNHYPQDLEWTAEHSHPALRPSGCAVFSLDVAGTEELVIAAEVQGKQLPHNDAHEILAAIRQSIFERHDLQVHAVVLLKPGGVQKTTSGKVQRQAMKQAWLASQLESLAVWRVSDMAVTPRTSARLAPGETADSIRSWLAQWLANRFSRTVETVDTSRPFAELGLESISAVEMASDLEEWMHRRIESTIAWTFPSPDALAEYLSRHGSHPEKVEAVVRPVAADFVEASETASTGLVEPIAIIGIGCRFPGGGDSPAAFWNLLRQGADAIGEIPASRWNVDAYYDADPAAPGKMYARRGGFVDDVDQFDAAFFGIAPREAADLDPQQRLLLEVAWESLEHAGIAPRRLRGAEAGIFVGISSDDHAIQQQLALGMEGISAYTALGAARSLAVGRLAYLLGVHGPAMQLDTACSSSLVAVYQACQSLQARECQLAVAGGVNLMLSPTTMVALCKLTALAPDGTCKTFDRAANGYVRGEGAGMVVLKRLSDAERDGDTIYACIRSAAINHDGASNGLTAPNGTAQEKLMRQALRKAGLEGRDVAYVEAHGTGTPLGDPIELEAIQRVYGEGRPRSNSLYVGSVKTNIGHLEAAAGIAGLIKVVLMLRHHLIVPHLHFREPTPHVAWSEMSVAVPTQCVRWPQSSAPQPSTAPAANQRRLAAVSAFGFSGTNAHLLLQAYEAGRNGSSTPDATPHAKPSSPAVSRQLFVLSADTDAALRALAGRYLPYLAEFDNGQLANVCFSAATTRDHGKRRLAIVAATTEELLSKLTSYVSGEDPSQAIAGDRLKGDSGERRIAFLYTGQGSQYVGMGRELYDAQPVFRDALDRCESLLQRRSEYRLTDLLFGATGNPAGTLHQTGCTQPALFALQYALTELYRSWGIQPGAVLGHSVGEYAAACAAGVLDLDAGLELVATRGELIQTLPPDGEMAVIMASESRVEEALRDQGGRLSIAAINGPDTIVISGDRDSVRRVVEQFRESGTDTETLNTSNAGHSALMEPILEPFRMAAEPIAFREPSRPMISNVTGRFAGPEIACASYWARHIRAPVRFADGIRTLEEAGFRLFVEIGPNPNLLAMGMGCWKDRRRRARWLPSLTQGRGDWETILFTLGELYVRGEDVDWRGFYAPYSRSRVALPTYPFQRQTFPLPVVDSHASRDTTRLSGQSSPLPSPDGIVTGLEHRRVGLEAASREMTRVLDQVAVRYVIRALKTIGFDWSVGAEFTVTDIESRVPDRHRAKVSRVLSRLVEHGWLQLVQAAYQVRLPEPDRLPDELLHEVDPDQAHPECDLLRRAGLALAGIWRGQIEPLTILFPDGSLESAARFYSESQLLAPYNRLAADVLQQAVVALPAGQGMRILEIGAGTGGLSGHLLPLVPPHSEYVFSDVSPVFLRSAESRFADFACFKTQMLDIARSGTAQGCVAESFDLIVAANVLHATPRLHETLAHVRELLRPGGWLMLLEGANPPLWGDMVFTLIDGWWSFEDRELRPDYPLMRRDRWCQVLHETGFQHIQFLNDSEAGDDSNHTLYVSRVSPAANATRGHSRRHSSTVPGNTAPGSTVPTAVPPVSPTDGTAAGLGDGQAASIPLLADLSLLELVRTYAARVMRLPAASIDGKTPLSELGLDSLMAIELRTQLGERLGLDLSMSPLRMRRSIEDIAAYLMEDHDTPQGFQEIPGSKIRNLELDVPRVHLVPLQPKGAKMPLFFVPAGYGDLLAFQDIANALGADQPVYGLQPASAKQVKTIRQMSVYRLVSAYISEIRKVQPHGPYSLSGYSAGAILAIEIARELLRHGDEIALLVIFDPPSHVPFWLDWFYAINYRLCLHTRLIDWIRQVRSRLIRRLFHTMLDEGLRTHTTVTREHRVAPYPGRITHFRARLSQSSLVSMKPVGWFWRKIALDGVEVHWIPGTHYGMLRGPAAGVVVDELYDCLQRAARCVEQEGTP